MAFLDLPRKLSKARLDLELALDKRQNPNPAARIVRETATTFITEQFTAGRKSAPRDR